MASYQRLLSEKQRKLVLLKEIKRFAKIEVLENPPI